MTSPCSFSSHLNQCITLHKNASAIKNAVEIERFDIKYFNESWNELQKVYPEADTLLKHTIYDTRTSEIYL
jgi:hypothetical protein